MDSDTEREADLKARLQYSRESVIQFQISVDAFKHEVKHAQGLLEANLSNAINSLSDLGFAGGSADGWWAGLRAGV